MSSGKNTFWGSDLIIAYNAATYKLLKNEKKALQLMSVVKINRTETFPYYSYYGDTIRDARLIDLFSRHFPSKASEIKAQTLKDIFARLQKSINTLSAGHLLMALDSYERMAASRPDSEFEVWQFLDNKKGKMLKERVSKNDKGQYSYSSKARKIEIKSTSKLELFYSITQGGFSNEKVKEKKSGLEVYKELVNKDGGVVTQVKQGDEITVNIKFRALTDYDLKDVVLVDLIPTGFSPVLDDKGKGVGVGGYSPDFVDTREDRVISYGSISRTQQGFSYKIKATHVGSFVLPSTLMEDMYRKEYQALSGEQKIVVEKP